MSNSYHSCNLGPWDPDEAEKRITITIEVEGRVGMVIQAIARLTGLTLSEVASREVALGTECSRKLEDFFYHVIWNILETEEYARIDEFAEELRKFHRAGHLHGVDEDDINRIAEEIKDVPDDWTKRLLHHATRIMRKAA